MWLSKETTENESEQLVLNVKLYGKNLSLKTYHCIYKFIPSNSWTTPKVVLGGVLYIFKNDLSWIK